jgi:hypothetical protein
MPTKAYLIPPPWCRNTSLPLYAGGNRSIAPEPTTIAMPALGTFGLLRTARTEDKSPKSHTDTAGTPKKEQAFDQIFAPPSPNICFS